MLESGNIIKFKHLSNFKTKEEFNQHINSFLQDHSKEFTKGELEAFTVLFQYAIKFKGIANARVGIFTKTANEKNNGFGFSRRTFERMIKKAVSSGILTVENTKRAKGGKGHNVYIFNRYEVQDITEKQEKKPIKPILKKIKALSKAIKNGDSVGKMRKQSYSNTQQLTQSENSENTTAPTEEQPKTDNKAITEKALIKKDFKKRIDTLDASFTSDYVPQEFKNLVQCFFNDAKLIEEYWRMAKIDTYHIRGTVLDEDTILNTAIQSFKQMIGKLKKGKVRNPIAYFKGVIKQKIDQLLFEDRMTLEEEYGQQQEELVFTVPATATIKKPVYSPANKEELDALGIY